MIPWGNFASWLSWVRRDKWGDEYTDLRSRPDISVTDPLETAGDIPIEDLMEITQRRTSTILRAVDQLVNRMLPRTSYPQEVKRYAQEQAIIISRRLKLAIERVSQEVMGLTQKIETLEQDVTNRDHELELAHDYHSRHVLYLTKFDALEARVSGAETIRDASLLLKDALDNIIPGATIRILLTPQKNALWDEVDSPIAQMLQDGIDLSDMYYESFMKQLTAESKAGSVIDMTVTEDGHMEEEEWDHPVVREFKRSARLSELVQYIPSKKTRLEKEWALGKSFQAVAPALIPIILSGKKITTLEQARLLFPECKDVPVLMDIWVGKVAIFLPEMRGEDYDDSRNIGCPDAVLKKWLATIGRMLGLIGAKQENQLDPLSRLPLRRFFYEKATIRFETLRRGSKPISFVMIDGDKFKRVNDTYGHKAGDLVIRTIADCLKRNLKMEDLIVRYGGEEFGVLMEWDAKNSAEALKRVKDDFEGIVFWFDKNGNPTIDPSEFTPGCKTFQVTLSIGIKCTNDGDVHTLDDAMKQADDLLYVVKNDDGRDGIRFSWRKDDFIKGKRGVTYKD